MGAFGKGAGRCGCYKQVTLPNEPLTGHQLMMAAQVKAIVLSEIGDQWHRTNLHRVSRRESLVEPEYLKFIDVTTEQPFHAWLVLRDCPGNGYGIIYDECSATFGLVQFADGHEPCLIGLYGDFFTTLEAM